MMPGLTFSDNFVEIFHSKLNKVVVGCTEEYLLQKLQRFSLTQTICLEYCFIANAGQLREDENLHKKSAVQG